MSNRPFYQKDKDLKYAVLITKKKGNNMDNTFKRASSEYAFNYTEHLVKRKADTKLIMARIMIIFLALILLGAVIFLTFGPVVKLPHIVVVAVLLIAYVTKLLWGFTSIEYEYLIVSGSMSMDKIYDGRKRRRMTEFNIREALSIAPLKDTSLDGVKVIFGATSMNDEDVYCAIYTNESGEKEALVFNVHEKALEMLRYYNKSVVIK